jgi:hypothetical protein
MPATSQSAVKLLKKRVPGIENTTRITGAQLIILSGEISCVRINARRQAAITTMESKALPAKPAHEKHRWIGEGSRQHVVSWYGGYRELPNGMTDWTSWRRCSEKNCEVNFER